MPGQKNPISPAALALTNVVLQSPSENDLTHPQRLAAEAPFLLEQESNNLNELDKQNAVNKKNDSTYKLQYNDIATCLKHNFNESPLILSPEYGPLEQKLPDLIEQAKNHQPSYVAYVSSDHWVSFSIFQHNEKIYIIYLNPANDETNRISEPLDKIYFNNSSAKPTIISYQGETRQKETPLTHCGIFVIKDLITIKSFVEDLKEEDNAQEEFNKITLCSQEEAEKARDQEIAQLYIKGALQQGLIDKNNFFVMPGENPDEPIKYNIQEVLDNESTESNIANEFCRNNNIPKELDIFVSTTINKYFNSLTSDESFSTSYIAEPEPAMKPEIANSIIAKEDEDNINQFLQFHHIHNPEGKELVNDIMNRLKTGVKIDSTSSEERADTKDIGGYFSIISSKISELFWNIFGGTSTTKQPTQNTFSTSDDKDYILVDFNEPPIISLQGAKISDHYSWDTQVFENNSLLTD
ncbi:MAG: hypothetical protein DGJ47_001116 [Rickettsiaceae bacterium]